MYARLWVWRYAPPYFMYASILFVTLCANEICFSQVHFFCEVRSLSPAWGLNVAYSENGGVYSYTPIYSSNGCLPLRKDNGCQTVTPAVSTVVKGHLRVVHQRRSKSYLVHHSRAKHKYTKSTAQQKHPPGAPPHHTESHRNTAQRVVARRWRKERHRPPSARNPALQQQ